jgi:photosystem II stability/assembly factor-like uncharacterized protein
VYFYNRDKGWVVGSYDPDGTMRGGVVLITENGGKTWELKSILSEFELSVINSVQFLDESHGWIAGTVQLRNGQVRGAILASEDGGRTWSVSHTTLKSNSGLSAVKFANRQVGWSVGENSILHTTDGGNHWLTKYTRPLNFFFDVDAKSHQSACAVGDRGKILCSSDGGKSWTTATLPTGQNDVWLSSILFIDEFRGWATGNDGIILTTSDSGKTWVLENEGASSYFRKVATNSYKIFVVGNGGIVLERSLVTQTSAKLPG